MNQQLDTPEKAAAFREAFHADVYDKALALTRNEASANALADHIFTMMQQRFANRVLPMNCLTYLKGQTTLLHTRLGNELNRMQTAEPAPVQETPAVPTVKAFRVHRVRRPAPAPVVIPEAEVPQMLNVSAAPAEAPVAQPAPDPQPQPVVKADPIQQTEPVAEAAPAEQPAPIVEAATREETIFDEDKTALWMPGESFDLEEHAEAQEAFRTQPKDTSEKRNMKLSIFNTFLFLCAIAATIFLLAELGLLPRLF